MAECRNGTYAKYCAGCRCPRCIDSCYRYKKRYRFDCARGVTRQVAAGPVTEYLAKLHKDGWSDEQIATSCGAQEMTVMTHRLGLHPLIWRTLANRFLSAKPTIHNVPATSKVRMLGSTRRVRALAAIGHSKNAIVEDTGLARSIIGGVMSAYRPCITAGNACIISDTYERLFWTPGDSDRSRNYAKKNDWAPPLAWDDIDDPNEEPNFGASSSKHEALIEDCTELIEQQGYTRAFAAERLGIKRATLDTILARYGKKAEQDQLSKTG